MNQVSSDGKSETPLERYRRLFAALERHKVRYVLVGGLAVLLHGFTRFTEDADLLIEPSPQNVERLKMALAEAFGNTDVGEVKTSDLKDYAVVRYVVDESVYVDLIARIGEIADIDSVEWTFVDFGGLKVKVATPQALLKLKQGSLRPKDRQDVFFLQKLIKGN